MDEHVFHHRMYRIGQIAKAVRDDHVWPDDHRSLIRPTIRQDWQRMRDAGVDPRGVAPECLDGDELRWRRQDPVMRLVWHKVQTFLRQANEPPWMINVVDASGAVLHCAGSRKVRTDAARHGFEDGVLWVAGTSGIKLIVDPPAGPLDAVHIAGDEHWVLFHARWACSTVAVRSAHTGGLRAVINVTGPWQAADRQPRSALVGLAADVRHLLSDYVYGELARLRDTAGPLVRRGGGTTLAIDPSGLVAAWHDWNPRGRDRVVVPDGRPGATFLPALGWCHLEPVPGGWLVRPHHDQSPPIRVVLDLTDTTQPWLRLRWPSGQWDHPIRQRRYVDVLRVLAQNRHRAVTAADLLARLPGSPGGTGHVRKLVSVLRKELGGLLDPRPYRFADNVTVQVRDA